MDLDRARSDLGAFADVIGAPLERWQAEALSVHAREQRETAIVGPRRSGKSRGAAVLSLHHCFRAPERHALVISSSEEGAKRLLAEARRIATRSPLLAASVVDEQKQELRLSNGSTLRCVAATEAAVRGWTASLVVADEAALISDEVLSGAARPIIASEPDGRFLMISSAVRAHGSFFDAIRRGEAGSQHTAAFRWSLADCDWISASEIEAARESMSEIRFRAEFLGEFASGLDALFSREQLAAVTADFETGPLEGLHPPARMVAGLDLGAVFDLSALAVVARLPIEAERPVFAVVGTKTWPQGTPLTTGERARPGVAEDVASLPCAWDTFVGEASGLGEAICGQGGVLWKLLRQRDPHAGGLAPSRGYRLIEETGDPQEEIEERRRALYRQRRQAVGQFSSTLYGLHVTAESKATAYGALALLVGRGQLVFRASDEELIRQLLTLRINLSPSGIEQVQAPRDSTGHSDLASALALCTVPVKGRNGWRSRLAELADGHIPLPADIPPARETVATGGGLVLPRRPALVSVAGPRVTVPGRRPELPNIEDEIPLARRPLPGERPNRDAVQIDLPLPTAKRTYNPLRDRPNEGRWTVHVP